MGNKTSNKVKKDYKNDIELCQEMSLLIIKTNRSFTRSMDQDTSFITEIYNPYTTNNLVQVSCSVAGSEWEMVEIGDIQKRHVIKYTHAEFKDYMSSRLVII